MATQLELAEADVIESAKTWKATRLNRSPSTYDPDRHARACHDLDQKVVALLDAQRADAERSAAIAAPEEIR